MPRQSGPDSEKPGMLGAPNDASMKEPAEGSRENVNISSGADERGNDSADAGNAGGITNRPLEQEQREQADLPPRGTAKEGGHA